METRFLEAEYNLQVASLHAQIEQEDKTIDKLVSQSKRIIAKLQAQLEEDGLQIITLQAQLEEDDLQVITLCNQIREIHANFKSEKRMLRRQIVEHEATIAYLRGCNFHVAYLIFSLTLTLTETKKRIFQIRILYNSGTH